MSNSSCIWSALQTSTRVLHRHQVRAAVKLLVRTRRHPLTWRSPLLSIVSCLLGHLFMSLLVHHVLLLQELLLLLHVLLQCQVIKARFWTSHAFLSMLLLMMLWPRLLVWMLLLRMLLLCHLLLVSHLLLLLLPLYHQLLLHDHLLLHHLLLLLLLLLLLDQLLSVCLLHCYVVDLGSWHPA